MSTPVFIAATEAQKLSGLSREQFRALVRAGVITPVPMTGGKFAVSEVMGLPEAIRRSQPTPRSQKSHAEGVGRRGRRNDT